MYVCGSHVHFSFRLTMSYPMRANEGGKAVPYSDELPLSTAGLRL